MYSNLFFIDHNTLSNLIPIRCAYFWINSLDLNNPNLLKKCPIHCHMLQHRVELRVARLETRVLRRAALLDAHRLLREHVARVVEEILRHAQVIALDNFCTHIIQVCKLGAITVDVRRCCPCRAQICEHLE